MFYYGPQLQGPSLQTVPHWLWWLDCRPEVRPTSPKS